MDIQKIFFESYNRSLFRFFSQYASEINEDKVACMNELESIGDENLIRKNYGLAKACFLYSALLGNPSANEKYYKVRIS